MAEKATGMGFRIAGIIFAALISVTTLAAASVMRWTVERIGLIEAIQDTDRAGWKASDKEHEREFGHAGMEARVTAVEGNYGKLDEKMDKVVDDVAEIKGDVKAIRNGG